MLKADNCRASIRARLVKNLLALLLGIALVSCVSAPVQEMSDARQAIDAARAAGAEQYAPDELAEAESELEIAETLLHRRHFKAAGKRARHARDQAIHARKTAEQSAPQ